MLELGELVTEHILSVAARIPRLFYLGRAIALILFLPSYLPQEFVQAGQL